MPRKFFDHGNGVSCWEMPAVVASGHPPCSEFYVYGPERGEIRLLRVCPSIGMAREVAAGL